jgi:hypothetical protein
VRRQVLWYSIYGELATAKKICYLKGLYQRFQGKRRLDAPGKSGVSLPASRNTPGSGFPLGGPKKISTY